MSRPFWIIEKGWFILTFGISCDILLAQIKLLIRFVYIEVTGYDLYRIYKKLYRAAAVG